MTAFTVLARATTQVSRVPDAVLLLAARLFPAAVFWQSGRTKMDGWRLSENALFLFEDEYRLPLIDPVIAVHLAALAEHLLPLLLVMGVATRLSALALLTMTAVIQLFVYPAAWPTHGVWATCFLLLIARGAGSWSLDAVLARRFDPAAV
jgi:putative oxidoreductase